MVAIDTSRSAAPQMAGNIIAAVFNLFSALSSWNDARVTRNALSRLSARELDDIGLCYGDIDNIVNRGGRV